MACRDPARGVGEEMVISARVHLVMSLSKSRFHNYRSLRPLTATRDLAIYSQFGGSGLYYAGTVYWGRHHRQELVQPPSGCRSQAAGTGTSTVVDCALINSVPYTLSLLFYTIPSLLACVRSLFLFCSTLSSLDLSLSLLPYVLFFTLAHRMATWRTATRHDSGFRRNLDLGLNLTISFTFAALYCDFHSR